MIYLFVKPEICRPLDRAIFGRQACMKCVGVGRRAAIVAVLHSHAMSTYSLKADWCCHTSTYMEHEQASSCRVDQKPEIYQISFAPVVHVILWQR